MSIEQSNTKLKEVLSKELNGLRVTLRASQDNLKLFADCSALESETALSITPSVTTDTLLKLITSITSIDLVDQDVIKSIAEELSHGQDIKIRRVARGREPTVGKDGRVLLLVKAFDPSKSERNENRNPATNVRHFDNIEVGAIVARVYESESGQKGLDIFGNEIESIPGKPAKISFDNTLELKSSVGDQGFSELVAKKAGYLDKKADKLSIKSKLVVDKDVDFKFGNIDFVGDVEIGGSVLKNFYVKARGNISIKGDVAQGTVHSINGSISVVGNSIGEPQVAVYVSSYASSQMLDSISKQSSVQLKSGNTFSSALLDGVSLESGGDINIVKEIRNSSLRCQRSLYLSQGALVGGSTYVVCGMEAKVIGSASGVTTKIILASSLDSTTEYRELQRQLASHESAEKLIRLYLGPYAEDQSGISKLSTAHQEKINGLLDKFNNILLSKAGIEQEIEKLETNQSTSSLFRISFLDAFYPGAEIIANEQVFTTDVKIEGKKTIEYLPDEKTFTLSPYKPIECKIDISKDHANVKCK